MTYSEMDEAALRRLNSLEKLVGRALNLFAMMKGRDPLSRDEQIQGVRRLIDEVETMVTWNTTDAAYAARMEIASRDDQITDLKKTIAKLEQELARRSR